MVSFLYLLLYVQQKKALSKLWTWNQIEPRFIKFLMISPANEVLLYYWHQRYTYRVLQTIQMKLILLCVWAELAILGSAKTALKFKYEI